MDGKEEPNEGINTATIFNKKQIMFTINKHKMNFTLSLKNILEQKVNIVITDNTKVNIAKTPATYLTKIRLSKLKLHTSKELFAGGNKRK